MKRHVLTGLAIALFGASMGYSGDAAAAWPKPRIACTAQNQGAYASTVVYTSDYKDTATYVCDGGTWVLGDVTRCILATGYCSPL